MVRLITIGAMLAGAAIFGLWLTLAQLMGIVQPLVVALSIMAAGLLVRLNRGMPTLDWKSLETADRKLLTQKIVELTRQYLIVLSLQAVTLAALLTLAVEEPIRVSSAWQKVILAFVGGLLALCLARMAYIVWRDHDIVRLQKKLIDDSADREAIEKAQQQALSNVAAIRASGLRPAPRPETSAWPK
jgi:hypothetical protein